MLLGDPHKNQSNLQVKNFTSERFGGFETQFIVEKVFRIFNHHGKHGLRWISPQSQLLICFGDFDSSYALVILIWKIKIRNNFYYWAHFLPQGLILLQLVGVLAWLVVEPPDKQVISWWLFSRIFMCASMYLLFNFVSWDNCVPSRNPWIVTLAIPLATQPPIKLIFLEV